MNSGLMGVSAWGSVLKRLSSPLIKSRNCMVVSFVAPDQRARYDNDGSVAKSSTFRTRYFSVAVADLADLDMAPDGAGALGGPALRRVQVFRPDQVIAAELFAGLDEGTVVDLHLAGLV